MKTYTVRTFMKPCPEDVMPMRSRIKAYAREYSLGFGVPYEQHEVEAESAIEARRIAVDQRLKLEIERKLAKDQKP